MSRSFTLNSNTAHKTSRALVLALVAVGSLLPTAASARPVPEIFGRVFKSGGEFEPFRIGVEEFRMANPESATADDWAALQTISDVVFADLDFSYLFESVRPDTLYLRIMGLSAVDRRGWHHLGASDIISGDVRVNGDQLLVTYALIDVASGKEYYRRELKAARSSARLLAHTLSDEVYRELANAEGIFRSQLVYVREADGHKEIQICDYDGANGYRLTGDRAIVLSPRWAGRDAVSYTSFRDGNPDVWLYDLVKDKATKISSFKGLNTGCSWTRDGRTFSLSLSMEGDPEVYIGQRNSKSPQRLTFNRGIDTSPCISPDGKKIVFTSDRSSTPQLYVMDADGANIARLTYEGKYNDSPDWSPTLDAICFVSRSDGLFQICTINPDGSGFRQLTEVGSNENPHWSPDGLHIVFSSNRTGSYEIYTMNFDGSGVRRVTTTGNNSNAAWSP
jgi:TolB protein